MRQGLFGLAEVLVIQAEAEVRVQVVGILGQHGLEDSLRLLEALFRPPLAVHVEVRQTQIVPRRHPVGRQFDDLLERLGRLGVLVLLHQPPAAVELGQRLGVRRRDAHAPAVRRQVAAAAKRHQHSQQARRPSAHRPAHRNLPVTNDNLFPVNSHGFALCNTHWQKRVPWAVSHQRATQPRLTSTRNHIRFDATWLRPLGTQPTAPAKRCNYRVASTSSIRPSGCIVVLDDLAGRVKVLSRSRLRCGVARASCP